MFTRRNWLLRFSIVLNVVVLCYVGTHLVSNNGIDFIEDIQVNRNLAAVEYEGQSPAVDPSSVARTYPESTIVEKTSEDSRTSKETASEVLQTSESMKQVESQHDTESSDPGDSVVMSIPMKTAAPKVNPISVSTTVSTSPLQTESSDLPLSERTLQDVIKCHDKDQIATTSQHGDYWVLLNYVIPSRTFQCFESITYTTHADFTFLDNLEPLLERWQGPVSVALHAPGTDFKPTLEAIQFLRQCGSPLVAELVTFHLYFGSKHVPKEIPRPSKLANSVNCSVPPPWTNVSSSQLYKTQKKLLYPVNIGRNIARASAVTHFILPSDIELYPSPGIIRDFLEMVRRQDAPLQHKNPKVFPLAIFEVKVDAAIPNNKTQLVSMLKSGSAIPFHKKVCPGCHNVPRSKEWIAANETEGLHVFDIGKRTGYFVHWEPIFIGTHQDPLYDERLSWEGKSDKMTQGYALCVLDYEFQLLDNAFLVHKPGIKTYKKDAARDVLAAKTNTLIRKVILPELRILYGIKKGCAV